MKITLDARGIMPTRAHPTDAGLDLYAPHDFKIGVRGYRRINTGVHVQLPENTVGFIKSKSGLMASAGILTDGTIDEGYTGEIGVVLFNLGRQAAYFRRGDRIAQLVIQPVLYPEIELAEALVSTDRGSSGFGSTGR